MIIKSSIDKVHIGENTAVCIGNFDGIHLGHRLIISALKEEAEKRGLKSLILSFDPHPIRFFGGEIKLISTPKKREELFLDQKTDYVVCAEFKKELADLSPEEFFKNVLVDRLNAKLILVGKDYRFGAKKAGSIETLAELGAKYGVDTIFADKLKDDNGVEISSSRIRSLIEEGAVHEAGRFLTRPYSLEGVVVHGDKKGRTFGYPTLNLDSPNELIPANGVYAAKVLICGEIYNAMAYVGYRPTIDNNLERRIEANIFKFDKEVYGEEAEIFFYEYVRGDIKFNNFDELINQMGIDKVRCKKILKSIDII